MKTCCIESLALKGIADGFALTPEGGGYTCDQCGRYYEITNGHWTPAVRFSVVAEHNHHGGSGWAIYDHQLQRTVGGWFADRIAAERTADVLNRKEESVNGE